MEPCQTRAGDALRVKKCAGKAQPARVPEPIVDTVVVAGEFAELPASAGRRSIMVDQRGPGEIGCIARGCRRFCRPESAAIKIGNDALPTISRAVCEAANQINFNAFFQPAMFANSRFKIQCFDGGNEAKDPDAVLDETAHDHSELLAALQRSVLPQQRQVHAWIVVDLTAIFQ